MKWIDVGVRDSDMAGGSSRKARLTFTASYLCPAATALNSFC